MNFNDKHPELREGEIFITNETKENLHHIGWKTKRIGITAYTINGEVIDKVNDIFPVLFRKKSLMITSKIRNQLKLNNIGEHNGTTN